MKAPTLLLAMISLAVFAPTGLNAQRIIGEPSQRPPVEPAEDILRRRGHILESTSASKIQADTAKSPVVRLREEARKLEAQFGAFQESGGVYKYRREDVVIETQFGFRAAKRSFWPQIRRTIGSISLAPVS